MTEPQSLWLLGFGPGAKISFIHIGDTCAAQMLYFQKCLNGEKSGKMVSLYTLTALKGWNLIAQKKKCHHSD